MNHCKDCKHFFFEEYSRLLSNGRGWCQLTRSNGSKPAFPDSAAVAFDLEGYAAQLQVSPEFGCVQWKPEPEEEPAPEEVSS